MVNYRPNGYAVIHATSGGAAERAHVDTSFHTSGSIGRIILKYGVLLCRLSMPFTQATHRGYLRVRKCSCTMHILFKHIRFCSFIAQKAPYWLYDPRPFPANFQWHGQIESFLSCSSLYQFPTSIYCLLRYLFTMPGLALKIILLSRPGIIRRQPDTNIGKYHNIMRC